jgi:putative transcriptional regulator
MSATGIRKASPKRKRTKHDWKRFDAMSEKEVLATARTDPDARPITPANARRMRRVPQVKVIRQALNLSQQEFAEVFGIPIGTLRDWEQGLHPPDQAARSYLKVIARDPDAVRKALEAA